MRQTLMTQILLAASLTLAHSGAANGQIYSSMNFNQAVAINAFAQGDLEQVVSATVPIQRTVTATTTNGGYSTATYNVNQSNAGAVMDISATCALTPSDYGAVENEANNGTMFTFAVPVYYTVLLSQTGNGAMDFYLSGDAYINTHIADSSRVFTGEIGANASVSLSEGLSLSNGPTYTSQYGSDSIQMTFTPVNPIPEPTSLSLLGIGSPALLARRRRVATTTSHAK